MLPPSLWEKSFHNKKTLANKAHSFGLLPLLGDDPQTNGKTMFLAVGCNFYLLFFEKCAKTEDAADTPAYVVRRREKDNSL